MYQTKIYLINEPPEMDYEEITEATHFHINIGDLHHHLAFRR